MCRTPATTLLVLMLGVAARAPAGQPAGTAAEPERAEPAAEEAFPYEGEVTADRVYIRAGDGANYTILAVAERGERVQVKRRRFEWLGIAVPKTCTVWIHKGLLTPAAEGKAATVARDRVNIRARALLTADIVGQLPSGARVTLVDDDGDWRGIEPPPQAVAWIHSKFIRKATAAAPRAKPKETLTDLGGLTALRAIEKLFAAQLAKPPKDRDFTAVLAAYRKVAENCEDPAVARRAEQAHQRLLKIVDLHNALRAAREPLKQFERKYDALEAELRRRARMGGDAPTKPEEPKDGGPEDTKPGGQQPPKGQPETGKQTPK